ncbi:MAG: GNAT family N-acetyltransferase [Burkholderiaceae bacterium]|nr:GNAT family N-acetyltransferase [Burkholderiaceae bacterium]
MAVVLNTARLTLRPLKVEHAAFWLRLVNDAAFLQFIGDKGLHTLDDAHRSIAEGPVALFAERKIGHFLVQRKEDGAALGTCGLIKRDALDDIDLGYAFLPEYRGQGFAFEAATAMLDYARDEIGLKRLVAIVSPDNEASVKLLERLGMRFERMLMLKEPDDMVKLFGRRL